MGFLDKMKAQASQVAQSAEQAVKTGQDKLAEAEAKKHADSLLRDLGAAVYAERSGRATAETGSEIERLLMALQAHEETHGPIGTPAPLGPEAGPSPGAGSPPGGAAPPGAAAPPAGDFKLDDL